MDVASLLFPSFPTDIFVRTQPHTYLHLNATQAEDNRDAFLRSSAESTVSYFYLNGVDEM